MKSVIVIPTYNESENIAKLIAAVQAAMPSLDIIVVDDNSPDGTADLAEAFDGVTVLRRERKLGLGTAYVHAYTYALEKGYARLGGMDADFSHEPSVLPALFGLLDDCDVGIGARYIPGGGTRNWGLHRQILSRGANIVAWLMLWMPAHDVTSGFRSFRREVLEAIDLETLKSDGYAFQVEILYRAHRMGYTIGETPILFEDRQRGKSKLDEGEIWGGITNLIRLRFGKY